MKKIFKEFVLAGILVIICGAFIFYTGDYQTKETQRRVLEEEKNYVETENIKEDKILVSPDNLIWKSATISAPWPVRDSQGAIVFQNKIWIYGGLHGNEKIDDYSRASYFNDIWNSEDGISWIKVKEHADWSPRRSMSIEYFKGKLWMFGGWSLTEGYKTGIWVSDDGINWMKVSKTTPWGDREGQTSAVFQNKLWMFGGVRFNKLGDQTLPRDVWSSEDGINWVKVTDNASWLGRYDHGTTVFNNKLWVVAGLDNGVAKNDIWSSEDGVVWTEENGNAPFEPRHGMPLFNYADRLWLVSGWGTTNNAGTEEAWYSEDGKFWQKAGENFSWPGREDQAGLIFKNKMWILGGMGPYWKWNNDVWYSEFK